MRPSPFPSATCLLVSPLPLPRRSIAELHPTRSADAPPQAPSPTPGHLGAAQSVTIADDLPPLQRSCGGSQLDLRWIVDNPEQCPSSPDADTNWPASVVGQLAPASLRLEAGATGYIDYVLVNDSSEQVALDVPSLACFAYLELEVLDSSDEPMQEDCIGGGGCSAPTARITLAAHGEARHRFAVEAIGVKQGWKDETCVLTRSPLVAGDYSLRTNMMFSDGADRPTASLRVRATSEAARALCEDAATCVDYGLRAQTGWGVEQSNDRARAAYDRACDLGEGLGCTMLAEMQTGDEAQGSYARAAEAFRLACETGSPGDCYQLGFLHEGGKGVPQDHAVAQQIHRLARV